MITSVNRDDLADGGAAHWAATVRAVRRHAPAAGSRCSFPDFQGARRRSRPCIAAGPDILNHNTETVPATLQGRPARRALRADARALPPCPRRGAGAPAEVEGSSWGSARTRDELVATMRDLRDVDVAILTLGQYLRPSASHLPVEKYYHPDEFAELAVAGRELGFRHVESGPLVRSSYHAKRQAERRHDGYAPIAHGLRDFAALVAGALLFIPSLIAPRRLTPVKSRSRSSAARIRSRCPKASFAIKFSTIAIFFI